MYVGTVEILVSPYAAVMSAEVMTKLYGVIVFKSTWKVLNAGS